MLAALDGAVARIQRCSLAQSDAALAIPWRLVNGDQEVMTIPRAGLFRSVMLNHWYHHRGQLTVYLRQLDVPLPIYGPSADERPFTTSPRSRG